MERNFQWTKQGYCEGIPVFDPSFGLLTAQWVIILLPAWMFWRVAMTANCLRSICGKRQACNSHKVDTLIEWLLFHLQRKPGCAGAYACRMGNLVNHKFSNEHSPQG